MPSEYTVTINLEPFLQRFLCSQFNQELGKSFSFPLRHDFNKLLEFSVMRVPLEYKRIDYGKNRFDIVLPHMQHKNVAVYNYLSDKRQRIFANKVRRYLYMLFHAELTEAVLNLHLTRIEAIDHLSEEFGFTPDDYDRLTKEYQRWYKREYTRRYRKSLSMQKV